MPVESGSTKKPFDFGGDEAEFENGPNEDPLNALRELVIEARNAFEALRSLTRNQTVPRNDFFQRPERPDGFERLIKCDNFLGQGGQVHVMAIASFDSNRSLPIGSDPRPYPYQPSAAAVPGPSVSVPGPSVSVPGPCRTFSAATLGPGRTLSTVALGPYGQGTIGVEIARTPSIGAKANLQAVMGAESGRPTSEVSEDDCEVPLPIKYARVSEIEAESIEECEVVSESIEVSSDSSLSNEDQ